MTPSQPLTLAEARPRLIRLAALTLAIYAIFVLAFPLGPGVIADGGGPASDLEMLMRPYRWFAPIYVLGVIALYYLFWRAMRLVARLVKESPGEAGSLRGLILGAGIVFGVALLWLYPITALDVFLYVVHTRLWVLYGASPMLVLPEAFPADPYVGYAGEFSEQLSPYGPLWELVAQIPARLGALDMISGVLAMKGIMLIAYAICAWLIGWQARLPPLGKGGSRTVPASGGASLVALTFFAWNPLVLMQGMGNGHNDMLMISLIVLGIVMWQRKVWWGAALALSLAATIKMTALLMLPLFGVVLLVEEPTWRGRILKGLAVAAIFLTVTAVLYRATGPLPDALEGTLFALFGRRGFSPASAARMLLREFIPRQFAEVYPRETGRNLWLLYYAYLLWKLWRGRTTLVAAGFMTYFSQLMLGPVFRIWYPLWLIPLAALALTSRTFWHTTLFGLTAELSIVNYFVVWRWLLGRWAWGLEGPLAPYWNYWTVMHLLTVPWVFGVPLLGPVWIKQRDRARFVRELGV